MTAYQQFQLKKYGNALPETDNEEYEYLNIENKESSEWSEKQAENELLDRN